MLLATKPGQSRCGWIEDYQMNTLSWQRVTKRKIDGHKPLNKAELLELLCQEWHEVTQQQCGSNVVDQD